MGRGEGGRGDTVANGRGDPKQPKAREKSVAGGGDTQVKGVGRTEDHGKIERGDWTGSGQAGRVDVAIGNIVILSIYLDVRSNACRHTASAPSCWRLEAMVQLKKIKSARVNRLLPSLKILSVCV